MIAAAAIIVLEALGEGSGGREPPPLELLRGPHAQVQARLRPIVNKIAERVERLRHLEFEQRPRVVVMGQHQFGALAGRIAREQRSRAQRDTEALRAARRLQRASTRFDQLAGLLPPRLAFGPDAKPAGLDRIGGAYDQRRDRIVILPTLIQTRDQLSYTLAHEFTHALESEHFGLGLGKLAAASEAAQARRAVIEGTATFVQDLYRRRYLHDRVPLRERLEGMGSVIAAGSAPSAINAQAVFDYSNGGLFVRALYRRAHGFRLVNRALTDPPRRSDQILHPRSWPGGGSRPPRVRLGVGRWLRPRWQRIGGGVAGEERALTILLAGSLASRATVGASGWNGGRFAVWRPRRPADECGRGCATGDVGVIAFRWRRRQDAHQFSLAVPAYAILQLFAERVQWQTWRVSDGYFALGTAARGSALAFAPTAPLARELAQHAASRAADGGGGI